MRKITLTYQDGEVKEFTGREWDYNQEYFHDIQDARADYTVQPIRADLYGYEPWCSTWNHIRVAMNKGCGEYIYDRTPGDYEEWTAPTNCRRGN